MRMYALIHYNNHNHMLYLALFVFDSFTYSSNSKMHSKDNKSNMILIYFCTCTCPISCRYGQVKNKALEESQEKKQFQTKCQGQNIILHTVTYLLNLWLHVTWGLILKQSSFAFYSLLLLTRAWFFCDRLCHDLKEVSTACSSLLEIKLFQLWILLP